jgi:hypothetical protein
MNFIIFQTSLVLETRDVNLKINSSERDIKKKLVWKMWLITHK